MERAPSDETRDTGFAAAQSRPAAFTSPSLCRSERDVEHLRRFRAPYALRPAPMPVPRFTEAAYRNSPTTWMPALRRFAQSVVDDSKSLTIMVTGGSITKGRMGVGRLREGERADQFLFQRVLMRSLSKVAPSHQHRLIEASRGGFHSCHWMRRYETSIQHHLGESDLLVIESAVNDGPPQIIDSWACLTEVLARVARDFPHLPVVLMDFTSRACWLHEHGPDPGIEQAIGQLCECGARRSDAAPLQKHWRHFNEGGCRDHHVVEACLGVPRVLVGSDRQYVCVEDKTRFNLEDENEEGVCALANRTDISWVVDPVHPGKVAMATASVDFFNLLADVLVCKEEALRNVSVCDNSEAAHVQRVHRLLDDAQRPFSFEEDEKPLPFDCAVGEPLFMHSKHHLGNQSDPNGWHLCTWPTVRCPRIGYKINTTTLEDTTLALYDVLGPSHVADCPGRVHGYHLLLSLVHSWSPSFATVDVKWGEHVVRINPCWNRNATIAHDLPLFAISHSDLPLTLSFTAHCSKVSAPYCVAEILGVMLVSRTAPLEALVSRTTTLP